MSEFDEARGELAATRAAEEADAERLAQARERLHRADRAMTQAARAADQEELEAAKRLRADAADDVASATDALRGVRTEVLGALKALEPFTDPRENLGLLGDHVPFLLLPVRTETRFATGDDGVRLLVRVYPDTCAIDTFEPLPSEGELTSVRAYWTSMWAAGGIEDDERGAWRGLVAAHGSGRAGWLADTVRPLNEDGWPEKDAREELVLAIATDAPPDDDERDALGVYWEAIWRAHGDADATADAREALVTAVGGEQRADELIALYVPANLEAQPATEPPDVTVAWVLFEAETETTRNTWTRAARSRVLPDRFVLVATSGADRIEVLGNPVPSPLVVGPDPSAEPDEQLRPAGDGLQVPDDMLWMVDFERAEEVGMGFVVNLTAAQASRGIDRLLVLGVRLSTTPEDGRAMLEELLRHHRDGRSGFELVPQGTPTNNTEEDGAGFTASDDADASFDARARAPLFAPTADPLERRDGEWVAELLGIGPELLQTTLNADGTDQLEARAMQAALWPGTLGYFLETMMEPTVAEADVEAAREFFVRHVRGRGAVPAIRVGRQPYGLLATTAFSRLRLGRGPGGPATHLSSGPQKGGFVERLQAMLEVAAGDWQGLSSDVAALGRPGDPHATLLAILGLHPASVQFHQRYAQSLAHLINHLHLAGLDATLLAAIVAAGLERKATELLARLGHNGSTRLAILDLYFHGGQNVLRGDVVDDRPLSETDPVRVWATGERNYLRWLADAASSSLDALRLQSGFLEDRPPTALLYLLLRHALMLGYHDAGLRLHLTAEVATPEVVAAMKKEPAFVHVAEGKASESRWAPLYAREPEITGSRTRTIAEHIADVLYEAAETEPLRRQVAALERLVDVPTARLERLFAEHVDCCGYRLDAWRMGLVDLQLERMRAGGEGGIHLGAYGWLEDIRPKAGAPEAVELPEDLREVFDDNGAPLWRDPANGGYIHAPSLDHATTAAILRNGYVANAADGESVLAVDLSSARVRQALALLEGIREGQSLGALLGYRLERGLHDAHDLAEVDVLVFALRKAFPLRADRLAPTSTEPGVPIEAIEARNVVDGLRLVEHVRGRTDRSYPWGLGLPAVTAAQRAAVEAEVDALLGLHDALSDLALAEGVHQAVLGNYDRVASTLDAYTRGAHPPDPDVVRTPTVGAGLTHRIGLHLEPGLTAPSDATPRASAEPAIDAWLASMLPPLGDVGCVVRWTDPATGSEEEEPVTLADLGLRPLDVLEIVRPEADAGMSELDDRVVRHAIAQRSPRADAELTVSYMDAPSGAVSVFATAALVADLRTLVSLARPLRAEDVALSQEGTARGGAATVSVDDGRVRDVRDDVETLRDDVDGFLATLQPLLDDLPAREDDVVAGVDGFADNAMSLLERGALFGIPQTGRGFAVLWLRDRYAALVARVAELVVKLHARLTRFDERLAAADDPSVVTPEERLRLLQIAELEVATTVTPGPITPDDFRAALPARRDALAQRRDELAALPGTATGYASLIAAVEALLPLSEFVTDQFTLDDERAAAVAFATDLTVTATALRAEAARRLDAADARLAEHDAAADGAVRADAVQEAARALLGDETLILPEFTLGAEQAAEWSAAFGASGALLTHLTDELEITLPVDEWLAGVARVRGPAASWERAVILAGGFGRDEPELTPIQLPHQPGDPWLAMQFPPDTELDRERLLYTAHYAVQFDAAQPQCGLLLDEWTEVIPGGEQDTAVALHFDRPNAEAPQAMLLVTPALQDGAWAWDDLEDAVEETFALARSRAVEPDQLDASAYARFLPATVMAATVSGISLTTTLALNNDVLQYLEADIG